MLKNKTNITVVYRLSLIFIINSLYFKIDPSKENRDIWLLIGHEIYWFSCTLLIFDSESKKNQIKVNHCIFPVETLVIKNHLIWKLLVTSWTLLARNCFSAIRLFLWITLKKDSSSDRKSRNIYQWIMMNIQIVIAIKSWWRMTVN